jgi:hypothetical protein
MALDPAPLTWLESLGSNSIDSWERLKKVFIDNFQGAITRAGTRHYLAQCKQERNELLWSYTRRFFDVRATITNISEDDIIDCFYNGITDPGIYRDFGRNRPKTVAGLRDMMHNWSEQEKMRERFPRRQDSNLQRPNDNRSDKGKHDFLGPPRKRKPVEVIAAIDHPSWGKKSTTQEEFEKLLQKKCPWHPGASHAAIDCYHLRRMFSNSGGGKKNKKPADKELEDDDQEDHGRNPKFQDTSKVVNVIFGGDEDFCSRRDQKLLLREILSIEPAVPRPLRWSEVPISSLVMTSGRAFLSPASSPWSWILWWRRSSLPRSSSMAGVGSISFSSAL